MKKEEIERIFTKLCDMGEIKHGHTIDRETLASLFDVDVTDTWDYVDPLLNLKAYLEEKEGMFCTTHMGDLCIAKLNDAPEYSRRRRKKADNIDKRTKKILENLDYREMNSGARAEAMLEKRLLELKLRNSRLIMREIEYYEIPEDDEE